MTMLSASANLQVVEAAVLAFLGYAVVFFGICLLLLVVVVMSKLFIAADKRKKTKMLEPVAEPLPEEPKPTAPGSAGRLMLHDVEPKTAALLMAIVADKLGKPINELRFISIREVK